MTGMQLIIPPLVEDEDGSPHRGEMAKNDTLTGTEEKNTSTANSSSSNSSRHGSEDGVLSSDLRDSFEAMKAVWRQAGRDSGDESDNTQELKRKARDQAIETALAVDSEVTKWQNGIAELEAMLAAAEDDEDRSEGDYTEGSEEDLSEEQHIHHQGVPRARGPPLRAVRFPSLPPVVVPDEDDMDETTTSTRRRGGGAN